MLTDNSISCKFCGHSDLHTYPAEERMFGIGGNFTYGECQKCGSLQLITIPEDLSVYYPSDYYSFSTLKKSDFKNQLLKKVRLRVFLATGLKSIAPIYGSWLKKIKPSFNSKIADVGCGNGQLLYELFASGFRNLHGFDPFMEKSVEVEKGLSLWKKTIEESDDRFDLIMMHHSFEHMENPELVLKSCFDKLNPGGYLLIRCPVGDSEVWKEKHEYWVQLDAPRHLIIPTVKGLTDLAEKVGLKKDEVVFDSTDFQFWGTAIYEKGISLRKSKLGEHFSKDELAALKQKALQYNQEGKGDQACFYFKKA